MSLPFDPNELSVKKALSSLDGLSDEELDALYEAELVDKSRSSLLDGLTAAREALHAPAEEEESDSSSLDEQRAANRAAIKAAGIGGSYVGPSV